MLNENNININDKVFVKSKINFRIFIKKIKDIFYKDLIFFYTDYYYIRIYTKN